MPLFGKKKNKDKKKEKGSDIEAPEEDGLLMARGADAPSLEDGVGESGPDTQTEEEARDLSVLDGGSAETPEAAETPPAAEEKSNADDLLSAFDDDDSGGELAELTKDLEDVPMAELIAELREIRLTLPPEALESDEDVA